MNSNECLQTSDLSSSPISIVSPNEGNHNFNTINIGLKPPPLLKAVARNRGQSLLKNNLISSHAQLSGSSTTTIMEENKRTMWKCKRCNFRHSNREIVSMHVKSHSEPTVQRHGEDKVLFFHFFRSFNFCVIRHAVTLTSVYRVHLAAETVHFPHLTQQRCPCTEFIIAQTWRLSLNVICVRIMSAQKRTYS